MEGISQQLSQQLTILQSERDELNQQLITFQHEKDEFKEMSFHFDLTLRQKEEEYERQNKQNEEELIRLLKQKEEEYERQIKQKEEEYVRKINKLKEKIDGLKKNKESLKHKYKLRIETLKNKRRRTNGGGKKTLKSNLNHGNNRIQNYNDFKNNYDSLIS